MPSQVSLRWNDEGGIDVEITTEEGHEVEATIDESEVGDVEGFLSDRGPGLSVSFGE